MKYFFFFILLKRITMSYCTIEEAWGHLGTEAPDPYSPSLSQKTKKKPKNRRVRKRDSDVPQSNTKHRYASAQYVDDLELSQPSPSPSPSLEHFTNPAKRSCPPIQTHQSVRYEAAFTRENHSDHIPEPLDVTLDGGGAPFEIHPDDNQYDARTISHESPTPPYAEDEEAADTVTDDTGLSSMPAADTPSAAVPHFTTHYASDTRSQSVHEELEWVRNNMSHLTHKIDKLTQAIDTSQLKHSTTHKNTQVYDTFIFCIVGVFVLVVLDIFFRAGKGLTV
jgi:hypothetical protein